VADVREPKDVIARIGCDPLARKLIEVAEKKIQNATDPNQQEELPDQVFLRGPGHKHGRNDGRGW
jgi:hypothetical protein